MKKTILFFALALISASTIFAQSNQAKAALKLDTAKKSVVKSNPSYSANPNRVYDVHLQLTYDQAQLFTMPDEQLARNPQLTGDKIGAIQDWKKDEVKEIWKQISLQADSDYRKWRADTAKKVKPKK